MADGTKIEWTDATWNPITGCAIVSPGCTNCYAMKLAGSRLKNHASRQGLTRDTKAGPAWTGEMRFNPQWLDQPLRWKKPRMIFVCAHGDLFAEGVPDEWIDQVFAIMSQSPQHTFQVLTKRPERMRSYLTRPRLEHHLVNALLLLPSECPLPEPGRWPHLPLPNVWLGVSTEDQKRADERIAILLETPGALHWISAEPLIGGMDPRRVLIDHPAYHGVKAHLDALTGQIYDLGGTPIGEIANRLQWVVVGGENGPRPMHPHWAMDLRDFSAAAGVPFLFKQWGSWLPDLENSPTRPVDHPEQSRFETCVWDPDENRWEETNGSWDDREQWVMADTYQEQEQGMTKVGKRGAGRLLAGIEHNGFPEIGR